MIRKTAREKPVEMHLKKQTEMRGGTALKILPWVNAGWPDRLLIFPDKIFFVETKSKTGSLSPRQKAIHKKLEALRHKVYTLNTVEAVNKFFYEMDPL